MKVTKISQLKVGDRVRWKCELNRYPFFSIGPGTGTVVADISDAMNQCVMVRPDDEVQRAAIREGWGDEVSGKEPLASSVEFHEDYLESEELEAE